MNENLPIRFDFSITPANWTEVSVVAIDWNVSGDLNLVAEIPGRVNRVGKTPIVRFAEDHVPPSVRQALQSGAIKKRSHFGEPPHSSRILTVLECHPKSNKAKSPEYDPRRLREVFMSLKEDTSALVKFLNVYGAWRDHFAFGRWFGASDFKAVFPSFVPPFYFWHYRSSFMARLDEAVKNPASWFSSTVDPPPLHRITEYPFHSYRVRFALEALEASVTFDLLKDSPMALCAREDCRNPYFVSRTGRLFCSERCARCVVARRARARNK